MRFFGLFALLALCAAAPVAAQTATFTLTGAHVASFTLPLTPTAIDPEGHDAGLDDATIFGMESAATVDGVATSVLLHFYTAAGGGGFDLIGLGSAFFRYSPTGDSLFTGTVFAPTFVAGDYAFTDFYDPALAYHLSLNADAVSAAPEPATWGMLLLGFGMLGGVVRRRRAVVPGAIRS